MYNGKQNIKMTKYRKKRNEIYKAVAISHFYKEVKLGLKRTNLLVTFKQRKLYL
jgi:hypothetical protein